jgi:serine/threonine protein phosphatase PrpC
MQDVYAMVEDPDPAAKAGSFYAIFDGHCGDNAAKFAKEHLHAHLVAALSVSSGGEDEKKGVARALTEAYQKTDIEFLREAKTKGWNDGSTGLVCFVNQGQLHLGHIGDCKAVLGKVHSFELLAFPA